MDDFLDIKYLISVLRRRWLLLLGPIVVGVPLAVLVALMLPPVYVSTARLLVESQQIPSDLARSTVTASAEERIALIEQRLSARENMLDLARRLNVFPETAGLTNTETVERMRAAMDIESAGISRPWDRSGASVTTIELSFRADRAEVAAQVANELLTQLLEQNVTQRSERAAETVDFFDREVDRLTTELSAMEAEIASFKRENAEALPESLDFRRSELSSLIRERFVRDGRLVAIEDRIRDLEEQIALGQIESDGRRTPEEIELARLKTALAQRKAVLTSTHPSIRSLEAQIAALETTVGSGVNEDGQAGGGRATETVRDIEALERERDLLQDQAERDRARIAELEASITRTPQIEIRLESMMRDYATKQAEYQSAVAKRANAATGERLEVNRQAERFEVIEQPQVPDGPVSPNRRLIAAAGGVLSIGVGFGLMIFVELINPSLRTPRELERKLNLHPIVSIPYVRTHAELSRRKWLLRIAILTLLVLLPLALFLIDQYYRPLPLLFDTLLQRTGIDALISRLERRLGG